MSRHTKTNTLIDTAKDILIEYHPMTVRQVYYQLVSRQVIDNNRSQYQAVSNALVDARQEGIIPWNWIEDRLRQPRMVSMWDDLAEFSQTAIKAYRRNVWETQPNYLEVWLEKDALSGIFGDILNGYGVTLNVGRGFDGWSSIRNAAERFRSGEKVTVLYFGDFDPSGEDMVRSLKERLGFFGCYPNIIKCALTYDDIAQYNLPPDFTKAKDTRSKAFVERYGDIAVELDALPTKVLQTRLKNETEKYLDMDALDKIKVLEQSDREYLENMLTDER